LLLLQELFSSSNLGIWIELPAGIARVRCVKGDEDADTKRKEMISNRSFELALPDDERFHLIANSISKELQ
jgi:hypothetical protein